MIEIIKNVSVVDILQLLKRNAGVYMNTRKFMNLCIHMT